MRSTGIALYNAKDITRIFILDAHTFFNEDTIKLTKTEMHSIKREFIRMQLAEDDTYEDDYLDNNELYRSLLKDALINKTHEQRTYLIREKKFQIISTIKEDILLS